MITREWYRRHKDKSREKLDEWLNRYANANFEAGIDFAVIFISRVLKEKSCITAEDIKTLKCCEKSVGSSEKYISPMAYKDKDDTIHTYDKFKL